MTLGEAFDILNTAGCRIVPDDIAGIALDIPPGAPPIPRELLAVLSANREPLVAAFGRPAGEAVAEDLAEYLATKRITGAAADLVLHAAKVFGVKGQGITIEGPDFEEREQSGPVQFFEDGIPFVMKTDTTWHQPGIGKFTIPAGTLGLAIPQVWAIADATERVEIERMIESHKRRGLFDYLPVWLEGRARLVRTSDFTFEGAAAPAGMNLTPWRTSITVEI